jgi:hypothetical protein
MDEFLQNLSYNEHSRDIHTVYVTRKECVMTFKEMAFQEELKLASPILNAEAEKSPLQSLLENQSPIIKVWFIIMVLNLGMFLLLIHS